MKSYRDYLIEAAEGPRIPHPEDSIIQGAATAARYVQALQSIAQNPGAISIKWDGEIALYFGKDANGQFFISDKYMYPKNVLAHSPNDWIKYDQGRGASRDDLYRKIAAIWPGLEAAMGNTTGVFKGDLMFVGPLTPVNGEFIFKPVTVEYHVPVDSELGKLIAGRKALIVAHQYNGATWSGRHFGNDQVTVIRADMGIKWRIKNPVELSNAALTSVTKNAQLIDSFLGGIPKVSRDALLKYFNHTATGKTNLPLEQWLPSQVSGKQLAFLLGDQGYLTKNSQGYQALVQAWRNIAAYKENLAQQLESQVQGFKQFVAGSPQGEGFVYPSNIGLIKLVQKGGFSSAHFAGFNAKK